MTFHIDDKLHFIKYNVIMAHRKLPRHLDDSFDGLFCDLAEKLVPWFHDTHHTPNTLTTYALVCSGISYWAIKNERPKTFALAFLTGYLFDCMDGIMARKYNQMSKFGDFYDHARDVLGGTAVAYIIYTKFHTTIPRWMMLVMGGACIGTMVHMGCQQRYIEGEGQQIGETLDALKYSCPSTNLLPYSSYFGAGTLTVTFVALTLYVMKINNIPLL